MWIEKIWIDSYRKCVLLNNYYAPVTIIGSGINFGEEEKWPLIVRAVDARYWGDKKFFVFGPFSIFSEFFSMSLLFFYMGKNVSERRGTIMKNNIGLRWTFSPGINSFPVHTETRPDADGQGQPGLKERERPGAHVQSPVLLFLLCFGLSDSQKYLEWRSLC